jgi:hypothetical protein
MSQKFKDYHAPAKNKYILKPIQNVDPYIYYKNYCIKGVIDWDFYPSNKQYTDPSKDVIKYSAYSGEDCSYYSNPHKRYLSYTHKEHVSIGQYTERLTRRLHENKVS